MSTSKNSVLTNLDKALSQNFDATKSRVVANSHIDAFLMLAFGQRISDEELIEICGAPSGSVLQLHYEKASTRGEMVPEGIHVTVENNAYLEEPMELVFHGVGINQIGVYIKLVVARKVLNLPSVGALIVESMTRAWSGIKLGTKTLSHFSMLAAGGRTWGHMIPSLGKRWDGFAVWARYGFDMPLLQETLDMFKHFPYVPPLAGATATCTKLSKLLPLTSGQEFWDLVGKGWYMDFDPSPTSYSVLTLSAYLARKYP